MHSYESKTGGIQHRTGYVPGPSFSEMLSTREPVYHWPDEVATSRSHRKNQNELTLMLPEGTTESVGELRTQGRYNC